VSAASSQTHQRDFDKPLATGNQVFPVDYTDGKFEEDGWRVTWNDQVRY
jgi:hypothetical protein